MKNYVRFTICAALTFPLAGCFNMPTSPAGIAGAYNSGYQYQSYSCSHLKIELDNLSQRENELAEAQEERVHSSEMQAFLIGFGQGDGVAANELADVKGDISAIKKVSEEKGCHLHFPKHEAKKHSDEHHKSSLNN